MYDYTDAVNASIEIARRGFEYRIKRNVNNKRSMKKEIKSILTEYSLNKEQTLENATQKILRLFSVSNRFSPEQMAEWFHNNYEEIAKAEGWQTQDKCRVEFKDLPENNKITMIKVCERWLNGC